MNQPLDFTAEVFKDERKRAYLNPDGADRALISPIAEDVLNRARRYRIARTRELMKAQDVGALLLYDPVNLRYVFDSSNMAIWCMHNPTRYGIVVGDGPAILFDREKHLFKGLPGIDEVRLNRSWTYFVSGEHQTQHVEEWADQVFALLSEHRSNMRVGVDHLDPRGTWALEKRGITIVDAQPTIEKARSIKSADELTLMRWTIRVCEAGMARMYEQSVPGKTEREIWAELHFENARSGGEWLETKLLSSGTKTNPWWTECSDRVIAKGEMIAFDTDMIGPYGYIADLSRSWTCGHTRMNPVQQRIYSTAVEQIDHNMSIIRPGMEFREFNEKSWRVPERYLPYRYSVALHGAGMADEWPLVPLHADWGVGREGVFEENMVVNVESLIAEAGSESVKLETQVVVTKNGVERLDSFPWEVV